MSELCNQSVRECLEGMARGDFSSRELTRALIERTEQLEARLHAYITFTPELALKSAEAADQARRAARGEAASLPPLLGLPLAVKDVLCLQGVRATAGSKILENFIPPFSATAVRRLLEAGIVPLGKTNTDEFAMGSSTENSAYGPSRNPWDTARAPGGSSGGSAAAVAARLAPAALGSDTGGSVRQPASFCGLTGLKPTYGRVSRYGLIAYGSSLDSVGVLARSAADAALIFACMAGFDPLDATSLELPAPQMDLGGSLDGLRVGVPQEYFIPGMQPEVERCVRRAVGELEALGARAVPVSLPHTPNALPVYYLIAPAEASANLARFDGVRYGLRAGADDLWDVFFSSRGAGFGAEVKRRIMLGTYALSAGYYDAYYGQAQKVRALIQADFERAFQQVDVIAAPVAPTTAFSLGGHGDDPLSMYLEDVFTLPANLAGVPGLAFPVGFDGQGLPVGMQLMGPHLSETLLLRAVHIYQQNSAWHTQAPVL